jgi:UDP-N-acetylenolpyruvoylglucosamine reductase
MGNKTIIDKILDTKITSLADYCKDKKLSELCSFRVGGIADYVVYPKSVEVLILLIDRLKEKNIKYCLLGNASNVLFSDNGFNGVVIFTSKLDSILVKGSTLNVECGVSLTHAAVIAQRNGLGGLEFAYGIPGTIGGAVYMNAGAYGGEMKDVVESSTYYTTDHKIIDRLMGVQHDFDYRESFYSKHENHVILSANLQLTYDDPENIKKKMDGFMSGRVEKQPLQYPSAGSVFKRYPGYYTGKLIEDAGLKGLTIGGAQVSEKHAGFIINRGGATAEDILKLIDIIKEKIYELNDIKIECEIKYIE